MRSLILAVTLSLAGASSLASLPAAPAEVGTAPAAASRQLGPEDAIAGPALPIRPRALNGALLVGADDDYALYHTGHVDPGTKRVDYTLVSLADGHVVRTLQPERGLNNIRLVDGSVVVVVRGEATRYDAATGAVTGTMGGVANYSALDDQWVLTPEAVHWFDGRVVPLSQQVAYDAGSAVRVLGDSDVAVVTRAYGYDPVAIRTAEGIVTDLQRPDEQVIVFAGRTGETPVLYGTTMAGPEGNGIVRWSDPTDDASRMLIARGDYPWIGGLAGDRVLVYDNRDGGHVAELDLDTGRAGDPLVDVVGSLGITDLPAYGDVLVQAGDGIVVSGGSTPEGEIVLVTETEVRDLGTLRPSPEGATRLVRSGDVVRARFRENGENRGSAELVVGESTWTSVPGEITVPEPQPDPDTAPLSTCSDPSVVPTVVDARARWQHETCSPSEQWITDTSGVLEPWQVAGGSPQLGVDHVAYVVGFDHAALAVTGLDAHHRTRVYGPFGDDSIAYSVDRTGAGDPVYADAAGLVRLAPTDGLTDRVAPEIVVTAHPPVDVRAVRPTTLTYAASARDAVDGDDVVVLVQARRAPAGQSLGPWRTVPGSAGGRASVTAQPGEQWCFRAVAADRTGNTAIGPRGSCSTVPVDDIELPSRHRKIYIAPRMIGGSATPLSGPDRLIVPAVPRSRAVLWLPTGPRLGRVLVHAGDRRVLAVDVHTQELGRLRVVVPIASRRLTVRSAGPRTVLVDAVGQRRLP